MGLEQWVICEIHSSPILDHTGDRMKQLIITAGAAPACDIDLVTFADLRFPILHLHKAYWLHDFFRNYGNTNQDSAEIPIDHKILQVLLERLYVARREPSAADEMFPTELGPFTQEKFEQLQSCVEPLFRFLQHAPQSWMTYYRWS